MLGKCGTGSIKCSDKLQKARKAIILETRVAILAMSTTVSSSAVRQLTGCVWQLHHAWDRLLWHHTGGLLLLFGSSHTEKHHCLSTTMWAQRVWDGCTFCLLLYSVRRSGIKPRFGRFRLREKIRSVRLHARHCHLCYALSTQGRVSVTEAVIIPRKIGKVSPQVPITEKGKMPEAPSHWGILRGIVGHLYPRISISICCIWIYTSIQMKRTSFQSSVRTTET